MNTISENGNGPSMPEPVLTRDNAVMLLLEFNKRIADELLNYPIDEKLLAAYAQKAELSSVDTELVEQRLRTCHTWRRALADLMYCGEIKSYRHPVNRDELGI